MPGKVIILYKSTWRPNRPTSPLWESERGKKSISLINLARLATLARLIWINKMACSFSSACCPQFNFDLLMELTPIWLAKFVWVDWACLASWRYGDKWRRQMCLFVQTLMTRTLRLYILRSRHAPLLLPLLCLCLPSLFSTCATANRCCEMRSDIFGAVWVWICFSHKTVPMLRRLTPSLPLLNLHRSSGSRQKVSAAGMKCSWGIHRENILTPAVHSLLFISSPWPVLVACRQISPGSEVRFVVKMVARVTGAMPHLQVVQTVSVAVMRQLKVMVTK